MKYTLKLTTLMSLIVFALCLTACGQKHEHEWENATCTEPKKCLSCETTEGEALGHDFSEPTCSQKSTCKYCGETEGEELNHNWIEATYTEAKHCEVCGLIEGEPLVKESPITEELITAYKNIIDNYETSKQEYEDISYNLVYINGDEVPELVVDSWIDWISVYTYVDGQLYTIWEKEYYGSNADYIEYVQNESLFMHTFTMFTGENRQWYKPEYFKLDSNNKIGEIDVKGAYYEYDENNQVYYYIDNTEVTEEQYKESVGILAEKVYLRVQGKYSAEEIETKLRNAKDGIPTEVAQEEDSLTDEYYKNASILMYILKEKEYRPEENAQYKFSLIDDDHNGTKELYIHDGYSYYRCTDYGYGWGPNRTIYEDGTVVECPTNNVYSFETTIYEHGIKKAYFYTHTETEAIYLDENCINAVGEVVIMSKDDANTLIGEILSNKKELEINWQDITLENIIKVFEVEEETEFMNEIQHIIGYINYKAQTYDYDSESVYHFLNTYHFNISEQGLGDEKQQVKELLPTSQFISQEEGYALYEVEAQDLISLYKEGFGKETSIEDLLTENEYGIHDIGNGKLHLELNTISTPLEFETIILSNETDGSETIVSGVCNYHDGGTSGYKFEIILEKNDNSTLNGYKVVNLNLEKLREQSWY